MSEEEKFLDDIGLIPGAGLEAWGKALEEKLGLSIFDTQKSIGDWLAVNAEKVSQEFINIVPNGDYDLLIDDHDAIIEYLRTEASKPENWVFLEARVRDNFLGLVFDCKVVDEGDTFKGFVFIAKNGKIKHAFAQNQDF
jgi:hypothetical protein